MLIRSILFQLGMWIFTIPFTMLCILTFPAPPMYRYKFISLWAKTMLIWLKWTCNITFRIKGHENIPKAPFLILSKHQSAWETLAFQKIFPPQVWVMKRELLFVPFFGWCRYPCFTSLATFYPQEARRRVKLHSTFCRE